MKTLYIIGNGFDLYHGLNTSYQSFAFYLQGHHADIYDLLTEYFGLPHLHKDSSNDDWDLWSQFEQALANMDYEQVLDDNSDYLANPAHEDFSDADWHALQIEMQGVSDKLTKKMFEAFKSFITAVHFPPLSADKKLNIDTTATFLNFNYTDTLERYYSVLATNILYIHGKASTPGITLVLGHGVEPGSFKKEKPKPPANATEEELEWWRQKMADSYDLSYEMGKDEILGYYYGSFKQTRKIIDDNGTFFDGLKGTEKVIVLGHSLGEVDHPYLSKVAECINNSGIPWIVSYHRDEHKGLFINNLLKLGIQEKQIHLIKMNEL